MSDYSKMRKNMVDGQIHTAGVVSDSILKSFATVPREMCVPERLQNVAYTDEDIDLGQGRYLLEPITHAKMLQAAELRPSDIVLDIGCASGYSTAILSPLVSTVIAIENNKRQSEKAKRLWSKLDQCNVILVEGDLKNGAPEHAPYSLIIINGAVPQVPRGLLDQLDKGGRLLTVLRKENQAVGQATLFLKDDHGGISSLPLFDAGTPILEEYKAESVFVF